MGARLDGPLAVMRVTPEGFALLCGGGDGGVGMILSLCERQGHLRSLCRGVIVINGFSRNLAEEDMQAGGNQNPQKFKDSDHEGAHSTKTHFTHLHRVSGVFILKSSSFNKKIHSEFFDSYI